MKFLKRLKQIVLLKRFKSKKSTKPLEISKESSTRELLSSKEDLSLLIEFIKPSNLFLGVEYENITKNSFQEVCDILRLYQVGQLIEVIEILTTKKNIEILDSNSQEFIKFVKWIGEQVKMVLSLYKNVEVSEFDEDDIAFQNAGADKLNRYQETVIFYSINKDPSKWPKIASVKFETMFTKLLIDKDYNAINKAYMKNQKTKNNG